MGLQSRDVLSERYAIYDGARDAATRAVAEQTLPSAAQDIEYQDEVGDWNEKVS
jgi:hypothetical protein